MLLIGGMGQIGQSLTPALKELYGADNVLVTDVLDLDELPIEPVVDYKRLNALDYAAISNFTMRFKPTVIYHLSAILSGFITS